MKKVKRVLWKIVKWGTIISISWWLLAMIVFGEGKYDGKKGLIVQKWSGLEALFTDEEFGYYTNKRIETKLDGLDGPYIFQNEVYTVNHKNELQRSSMGVTEPLLVRAGNKDLDSFYIELKDSLNEEVALYPQPKKLIAISDIEGNFNAFYSFLIANQVMDNRYNWTFGDGHLVLNGDFVDRGTEVTAVLWLIYMLEEKALEQGGKVHFIIGNHETMNLYGAARYVDNKYIELAKQISGEQDWDKAYRFLYSNEMVLGKWLRTKNVIEKIGGYIFVHAGLSPKLVEQELTITDINQIAKKHYGKYLDKRPENEREYVVLSSHHGPYWYRGMALAFKYKLYFFVIDFFGEKPAEAQQTDVNKVLAYYQAKKVVIGHTVVDDISTAYEGKVIRIDLKHGKTKNSPKTKGLLIEEGVEYKVDALGKKEKL